MTSSWCRISSTTLSFTSTTAFQHLEILSYDFCHVDTLSLLVIVTTSLNTTCNPDKRAFFSPVSKIFSLLAPHNDIDKISLTFAILTLECTVYCKSKSRNCYI
ncbi:Uncharacterised protein [Mycobacteroides abscessus subsp. abscessus]|nr:Uncharacterised protein [Mycobacteroides abscessus subsp. abscessus]